MLFFLDDSGKHQKLGNRMKTGIRREKQVEMIGYIGHFLKALRLTDTSPRHALRETLALFSEDDPGTNNPIVISRDSAGDIKP